jgi:hypothetical protein
MRNEYDIIIYVVVKLLACKNKKNVLIITIIRL